MHDETDALRRKRLAEINAQPKDRADLESKYGTGNVFDTRELAQHFIVIGFAAPMVVVRRKADGAVGSLFFQHQPRFYFDFQPD